MKYIRIFIIVLIILLTFTACQKTKLLVDSRDITDLAFVRITGLDCSRIESDGVRLSVGYKEIEVGGGEGGGFMPGILKKDGKDVLDALDKINMYSDEEVYWGHNEVLLISERQARKSIFKFADFFIRDNNMSPDMLVFITKGCTSEEIIKEGNDKKNYVTDRIKNIMKGLQYVTSTSKVELLDVINSISGENCGIFVPYMILKKDKDAKESDMLIDGYSIFKKDRLLTFISGDVADGLSFLLNKVKSGDIRVQDKKGKEITLEIVASHTSIEPRLKEDKVEADIKVDITTNIEEYLGDEDIFGKEYIKYLIEKQSEQIKKKIEQTLYLMQMNNIDLVHIGYSHLYKKYPNKWRKIKEKWPDIYPLVKFNVTVDGDIDRTYSIKEPIFKGN